MKDKRHKKDQEENAGHLSEPVHNPLSGEHQTESGNLLSIRAEVLKLSEDRFHKMISEVDEYAVILLSREGLIITWNKGAERIKGYTAEEVIGKSYKLFYAREDRDGGLPDRLMEQAVKEGKAKHEGWRIRKDGSRFWGSITITALHDDAGRVTGFLKITQDQTQKKIAEDKNSIYMDELASQATALRKSEERYHQMIAEVQDYAIILLDKNGIVLDWNKGAEKLKGYKPEEIIGKSFRLFYPRESKEIQLPESLLHKAAERGSVLHEGWRVRKDGTRFWGSVAITALHNEAGEIIGYSKVTRDLTQRKMAEDQLSIVAESLKQKNEELRQSEERYHRMVAEVQDYAIIMLNVNGEIENWNTGAEFIKGYKAAEVVGKHFRLFYPPEDRHAHVPETLLEQARNEGKAMHEGWRLRKDGTRFWGSVVITALHNRNGDLIGYSKVTRDLTERKAAEDALKASAEELDAKNKALEQLNAELGSFTYVASHDLKEPLRKIQIFISRIAELNSLPESSKNYFEKINNSAIRMQTLIDDLLSYSRITNDSNIFEKTDLNETLKMVTHDLEVPINEKKAIIKSNKLPVINGVRFQLHQVFLNLLNNSLKFSKPGKVPVIDITYQVISADAVPGSITNGHEQYHHISVRDNGVGFEQEFSARIFEAFQRLQPKHLVPGTGIGLSIVKKVVENHHGKVSAEGHPDIGATFHLYFPVSK